MAEGTCGCAWCACVALQPHSCLWLQGELDELCESFLDDKFDVRIDFAIEESLPRLRQYGLVDAQPDPDDPRVKAPELATAHGRLLQRWQRCAPTRPPRRRHACLSATPVLHPLRPKCNKHQCM